MFWLRFLKGWPNQAAAHLQICPNLPRKAKNGCHSVQGKARGVKICIIVIYYLENMWKERKLGFICYFKKIYICFYCFSTRELVFFTIEKKTSKLNVLKKRSQNILKVTYNVEKYLNIWIWQSQPQNISFFLVTLPIQCVWWRHKWSQRPLLLKAKSLTIQP